MREHVTQFNPNPIQKQFIESRAKADLFSSRRGEGKSTALCWSCLYHTRQNPGAKWAMIRDTWENLQATTMATFFEWFPPGVYGEWSATRKTFKWAEGVASGSVAFLGMDDPADAAKLMSRELGGIGIDEPAPAIGSAGIDEMIFDLGLSSLRQQGMQWYACKLAENNPDESHWTYRRFVLDGRNDFILWQPSTPENMDHLPADYYESLRSMWKHRPDLIRRFVDGQFGFQQEGKAVTPQWSDRLHLGLGLSPIRKREALLCWDFGHNPTCVVTQITPHGHWMVLDAVVGEDIGVEELLEGSIVPLLQERYRGCSLRHFGDPAGAQREQTSTRRSAVRLLLRRLGGSWRAGPVRWDDRIEPLRSILSRTISGVGTVQVDRERASAVWHALRGGWHFPVARGGTIGGRPKKNISSHPGDALSYGAARLFPIGERLTKRRGSAISTPQQASYFDSRRPLGFERPGLIIPGAPSNGDTSS